MRLTNDRSYTTGLQKPPDILRVVLVEDSMVYGQGVHVHETLPARLEMLLNAAIWQRGVEVANLGRCGNSIYENWLDFTMRAGDLEPDLVVLVLCENDAELESVQERYEEHVERTWDPDQPTLPYFGPMMARFAGHAERAGLPLVVAFYAIDDRSVIERAATEVGEASARAGLPFVDLSAAFRGESSSRRNHGLRVSDVDPHPSAAAHAMAAHALARGVVPHLLSAALDVRSAGLPTSPSFGETRRSLDEAAERSRGGGSHPCPDRPRTPQRGPVHDRPDAGEISEACMYRRMFSAVDAASSGAGDPLVTLPQAIDRLDAKRRSRARSAMGGERLDDSGFEQLRARCSEAMNDAVLTAFLESYTRLLEAEAGPIAESRQVLDAVLREATKVLHVHHERRARPDLALPAAFAGDARDAGPDFDVHGVLDRSASAAADIERARATLGRARPACREELPILSATLQSRWRAAVSRVAHLWSELEGRAAAVETIARALHAEERAVPHDGTGKPEPTLRIARWAAEQTCALLERLVEQLRLPGFTLPSLQPGERPALRVTVQTRLESDRPCTLVVGIRSPDAGFARIEDHRVLAADGRTRAHTFELPCLFAGRLTLTVSRPDRRFVPGADTAVRAIDVTPAGGPSVSCPTSLLRQQADGGFETPRLWFGPDGVVWSDNAGCAGGGASRFMRLTRYVLPTSAVQRESGHCFTYAFRTNAARMFADLCGGFQPLVFEDGQPMGPGAFSHDEIRAWGGGRFSFWNALLYFSSSDNADPGSNGREYALTLPTYLKVLEELPPETIGGLRL